ncbi:MAG: phosphotransferase [Rhodobacteraceae bacterium]|nr:phosphotransferase [Paracoccaceae bacterium]
MMPLWCGPIDITPLSGGLTNLNFIITDGEKRYVLRSGGDAPEHNLMRFGDIAASHAAERAGLSPKVYYAQNGMTVIDYIESKTLTEADVRSHEYLQKIIPLMQKCHRDMPQHFTGPALIFWVFHAIRDYYRNLLSRNTPYAGRLPDYMAINAKLETAAGPHDIVFCHNDWLAANILDDGTRLWLIDWDYGGFNTPLFDLGGLASNNSFDAKTENWMLENYFDSPVTDDLMRRYHAMKCASLLREVLWSMLSELTSELDIDYAPYTLEQTGRFERAYDIFLQS